jgi:hypothetical protein
MMRDVSILEPSVVGKGWRSIIVIVVFLYCEFLHIDHAVARPNTPLPIIKTDEGVGDAAPCETMVDKITMKNCNDTEL